MTTTQLPTVTVAQAAVICGVAEKTVRRWMATGVLKAVRVGARLRTSVEWINAMAVPVAPDVGEEIEADENAEYEAVCSALRRTKGIKAKVFGSGVRSIG